MKKLKLNKEALKNLPYRQPKPTDYNYRMFNSVSTQYEQEDNFLINKSTFEQVLEDLGIITGIGVENYNGGLLASHKLHDILTNNRINRLAHCFNLVAYIGYGATYQQVNKYWKSCTTEQQNKLNDLFTDYMQDEYNYLINEC